MPGVGFTVRGEGDKVIYSDQNIQSLINLLFQKVKEVYDVDSPRLSKEHKAMLYETMQTLNKSANRIISVNIEKTHDLEDDEEMFETDPDIIKENEITKKFQT